MKKGWRTQVTAYSQTPSMNKIEHAY